MAAGSWQNRRKKKLATGPNARPTNERCFYGVNACSAIVRMRPMTVRKVIVAEREQQQFSDLLKWADSKKVAIGVATDEELESITGSKHHQGICAFARDYLIFAPLDVWPDLRKQNLVLYLDGIGNPHNVGAILRTAAHFGIHYIVGDSTLPKISPAAARTAEGAAEHIRLVRAEIAAPFLRDMKREGFSIVAASLEAGAQALQATKFPERMLLVLGSEVAGISEAVQSQADLAVQISGTGLVESLNVSVTAAIFLHEWSRQAFQNKAK